MHFAKTEWKICLRKLIRPKIKKLKFPKTDRDRTEVRKKISSKSSNTSYGFEFYPFTGIHSDTIPTCHINKLSEGIKKFC